MSLCRAISEECFKNFNKYMGLCSGSSYNIVFLQNSNKINLNFSHFLNHGVASGTVQDFKDRIKNPEISERPMPFRRFGLAEVFCTVLLS
jgi:hypothetical protein